MSFLAKKLDRFREPKLSPPKEEKKDVSYGVLLAEKLKASEENLIKAESIRNGDKEFHARLEFLEDWFNRFQPIQGYLFGKQDEEIPPINIWREWASKKLDELSTQMHELVG